MYKISAAVLLLASSVFASADVTNPVCKQSGPNTYTISYGLTGKSHRVTISASTNPTGTEGLVNLLQTEKNEVTVTAGQPGERMYFFLTPDQGRGREVSIRHIALEGTPNFRDIGGYETSDGRFVKWGLIYRSGVLTYLTSSDYAYLRQLNVQVVCDFRTNQENEQAPEQWIPGSGASLISLPIGADSNGSATASIQKFADSHPTIEQFKQMMAKTYATFAFQFAPEYANVFTQLKQDRLPLTYHCTAGKDRTGVFTALLLRVLGVPQQTVFEDYALTNEYLMSHNDHSVASQKAMAQAQSMMKSFTPEQRKVLMAADPEYLKSAFAAIDERYGSFDNFRRQVLALSDADVSALRTRLLAER
jgi:protein-tyrosine phosphatase